MRKKSIIAITIFFSIVIGIFLRVHAQSPYKFYPDSYLPLVVAENINSYGLLIGPMGMDGMLYPDFFSWTRPMYPLLISTFSHINSDPIQIAQILSLVAGILAVPIAYFYISRALSSRRAGLLGALLLATSFNHVVWGGFILSDTTGVLFLFITLVLVFHWLNKKFELADWRDIIIGAVFACAVLARYEYIVLALPFIYLFFATSPNPLLRLTTITAAMSMTLASAYALFSPLVASTEVGIQQIGTLFDSVTSFDLRGLQGFIHSDSLLVSSSLLGIFFMLQDRKYRPLSIFSLLSVFILAFVYYQTNPAMQRYFIHLIPFILLPASLGFFKITELSKTLSLRARYFLWGICCVGLVWQSVTTYQGIHYVNNGIWFESVYEEQAAKLVAPHIPAEAFIIASFPEPYFMETKHSVHSIANTSPFVHIASSLDQKTVIIVEDEGMRHIFPEFTKLLHKDLKKYMVKEIHLSAIFRDAEIIKEATEPIRLYHITLGELKSLIK